MSDLTAAQPTTVLDAAEAPVVVQQQNFDAVEGVLQSIPEIVKESKEGYKTTEFWLAVAVSLLTLVDVIPLPGKYEALVPTVLAAAYALSRGLAKKGVPVVEVAQDAPPA